MSGAPEATSPLLVGRSIGGKFVVSEKIGEGAMGAVFRARQTALDRDVAVKVMHAPLAADPTFAARFQREAKAASRLDHPNVVRIIDYGQEPDGVLYMAMELLDGRDLFRVIDEEWPLSHDRIVDLLSQTLAALAVAHDAGILHRDLKPENIMVLRRKADDGTPTDLVKVCDFGIAKLLEAEGAPSAGREGDARARKLSTEGIVVGTPEYMSPEQARGEAVDARSDVYAVGVILYQMLTRRLPYEGNTPLSVVIKALQEEPRPIAELGPTSAPALEPICLKAMSKRREDRYQGARELRAALRESRSLPASVSIAVDALHRTPMTSAPTMADGSRPSTIPTEPRVISPRAEERAPEARASEPAGVAPDARGRARRRASWGWALIAIAVAGVGGWALASRRGRGGSDAAASGTDVPSIELASATEPARTSPGPAASGSTAPPPASAMATPPASAPSVAAAPASPALTRVPSRASNPSATRAHADPTETAPLPTVSPAPSPVSEPAPPPAVTVSAAPIAAAVSVAPPPAPSPAPAPAPSPVVVAPPTPPPIDLSRARVELGQPRSNTAAATALGVARAMSAVTTKLTGCWRAALAQSSVADDAAGTVHLETDDQGYVTAARVAGPIAPAAARCIEDAIVRGVHIDVDTGTASADVPLAFRVR